MCGRYNIISDPLTRLLLELTGQSFAIQDAYNLAPTESVPVLRRDPEKTWQMEAMRWWLVPSWSKSVSSRYAMFNARAEGLSASRAYAEPFRHRRCLIPVSGYYEWKKEKSGKQPYYITPDTGDGFLFAGLWERWKNPDTTDLLSCTIVTKAAKTGMSSIHARVPVALPETTIESWLDPAASEEQLKELLLGNLSQGEQDLLVNVTPVSSWMNNARHKDRRCIESIGASQQFRL